MNWATSHKCLVIAHRGDTKGGIENRLPAIESALRLGVDGVEVDLRMTRDERIVLHHDPLQKEKATSNLTTLEELLDLVRDRLLLNLEIKTEIQSSSLFNTKLVKRLMESLARFHLQDSILVSSFHPLTLWQIRRLSPALPRGYLYEGLYPLHRQLMRVVKPFSVNIPLRDLSQALADEVHQAGRRFFVWTVNHEDDMRRCIAIGVDGIITDEPRRLLPLLK